MIMTMEMVVKQSYLNNIIINSFLNTFKLAKSNNLIKTNDD